MTFLFIFKPIANCKSVDITANGKYNNDTAIMLYVIMRNWILLRCIYNSRLRRGSIAAISQNFLKQIKSVHFFFAPFICLTRERKNHQPFYCNRFLRITHRLNQETMSLHCSFHSNIFKYRGSWDENLIGSIFFVVVYTHSYINNIQTCAPSYIAIEAVTLLWFSS